MNIMKPDEIENKSFEIITDALKKMGVETKEPNATVLKRVIHATADFDYVDNLCFSSGVVEHSVALFRNGCAVVTDTNMALAGISKPTLQKSCSEIFCYIKDPTIILKAKSTGVTRAALSMEKACELKKELVIVVGNAPTALMKINELIINKKISPSLIIAVPVGFVNVIESKELILSQNVPYIVAKGRKGGSNVAAAIVNALLYMAFPRDMDKSKI